MSVRSEYLISMKAKKSGFGNRKNEKIVIWSTHTIVHPYLGVSLLKYVADKPTIIFNNKKHNRP